MHLGPTALHPNEAFREVHRKNRKNLASARTHSDSHKSLVGCLRQKLGGLPLHHRRWW